MNIESNIREKVCSDFSKYFSNYFDWNDVDVTFFNIDLRSKETNHISNNYEWLLTVWDDDLDLSVGERLSPGFQYWSDYSNIFMKTLQKTEKRALKIDICSKLGNVFEIISISSKRKLSLEDTMAIYKFRPVIADYAHSVWAKNQDIVLPVRAKISTSYEPLANTENSPSELLDIHQYMRFGNIRFTRKEMVTIRLLLSHCRVKEISYIQDCSEASEHKRIQRIKDKLGCGHTGPSALFSALKEHGITLACLETLVSFP